MDKQPPVEPSRSNSRLEDEVLEILHKADRPSSNVVKFQSRVRRRRMSTAHRLRNSATRVHLTGLNLLIATVVLAILAAMLDDRSALLGRILALLSVACLIGLFVRRWVRPEQPQIKTWRGRDVDFRPGPQRPEWLDRFLRGPKGPRR